MELKHLQQLLSTQEKEAQHVAEAKSYSSDFDGIRSIVEDALDDLCDKLCKGGALEELMKSSGAANLDTVKDKDGFTIQGKLDKLTTDYKKQIEKLLMEAETLVMQVSE